MSLSKDQAKAVADALATTDQSKRAWSDDSNWWKRRMLFGIGGAAGGSLGFLLDQLVFGHPGVCLLIGFAVGVLTAWYLRRRVA